MPPCSHLTVETWIPPLTTDQVRALTAFLAHKGPPWVDDLQRRLRGELAGSADYFYVALNEEHIVGHAWYNVARADPRVGLVGHLFTHPDLRRQGIATRLLEMILRDFRERGGWLMQLFTSTPHSVPLYERLGFEITCAAQAYHDQDWSLRFPAGASAATDALFTRPVVRQRPLACADLPAYCLLYTSQPTNVVKDRAQQIGTGVESELAFLQTMDAIAQRRCLCTVLENPDTLVGIASLMRSAVACESHVALLDVYLHAAHEDLAVALSRACLDARHALDVRLIYALASDARKRQWLAALGFRHWGDLPGHYRVAGQACDAQLFRWSED